MKCSAANTPFVIWATCFLWIVSAFALTLSLLLFLCVGDMLTMTGTDVINAFVLLSGLIMLPTNVYMLYCVANGKKIERTSKVLCCPIWCSILCIIAVNTFGAILCIHRIVLCRNIIAKYLQNGMKYYRHVPRYKHFIDNLQWSLKCCGVDSYRDWFSHDWFDKIRDYEWDPNVHNRNGNTKNDLSYVDSVPLSCCKSGSCISNYLNELGTHSINKHGCKQYLLNIVTVSMYAHLTIFLSIVLVEICILNSIATDDHHKVKTGNNSNVNVRHIMPINDHFEASSASCQMNADESDQDTDEVNRPYIEDIKMAVMKGPGPEKCAYNADVAGYDQFESVISQNWNHE